MSKKLRTLEDLLDKIEADQAWRKDELISIDNTIYFAVPKTKKALLRAGVAILYAHWEGFVKITCQYYIEYVANQKLKLGELHPSFVAKALHNLGKEKTPLQAQILKFEKLIHESTQTFKIPTSSVSTSNLNFSEFAKYYDSIGLEWKQHEKKRKLLDLLVEKRNHIAHGKELPITESDYKEYYLLVIELIDKVADDIMNAAIAKQYQIKSL